jgi:Homing endonuclease associated repeat
MPRGYPRKAKLWPKAQELAVRGWYMDEIANELGIGYKTLQSWFADPDGAWKKARIESYAGICRECGGKTSGCNGREKAASICVSCSRINQKQAAAERILTAINQWADKHGGVPPRATDWARREPQNEGYPYPRELTQVFGSWNEAIRCAGYEPRVYGHYGRPGDDIALCREIRDRYETGISSPELAKLYECSPQTIAYRIRKAGGSLSKLRESLRT